MEGFGVKMLKPGVILVGIGSKEGGCEPGNEYPMLKPKKNVLMCPSCVL